jgi:hypothetical protein
VVPPARIDLAAKLYLLGRSPRAIQHRLVREFGVDPRTARRYLARAKKQLGAKRPVDPAAGAARSEALQLEAFALARTQGDSRAMSLIAHRLAELDGALVQRLEHSGPGGGPIPHKVDTVDVAQLAARIDVLCAGVAGAPEPGAAGGGAAPADAGGAGAAEP